MQIIRLLALLPKKAMLYAPLVGQLLRLMQLAPVLLSRRDLTEIACASLFLRRPFPQSVECLTQLEDPFLAILDVVAPEHEPFLDVAHNLELSLVQPFQPCLAVDVDELRLLLLLAVLEVVQSRLVRQRQFLLEEQSETVALLQLRLKHYLVGSVLRLRLRRWRSQRSMVFVVFFLARSGDLLLVVAFVLLFLFDQLLFEGAPGHHLVLYRRLHQEYLVEVYPIEERVSAQVVVVIAETFNACAQSLAGVSH